jgi:hypothetical protein
VKSGAGRKVRHYGDRWLLKALVVAWSVGGGPVRYNARQREIGGRRPATPHVGVGLAGAQKWGLTGGA